MYIGKHMLKPKFKHEFETLKDQVNAKKTLADFHSKIIGLNRNQNLY